MEVSGDKDDSRSLHITIHKPAKSAHARPIPLLAAKFIFDDHIRCMAAKQRLVKGRLKARQQKMQMIERLLDIPVEQSASVGLYNYGARGAASAVPGQICWNSLNNFNNHRFKQLIITDCFNYAAFSLLIFYCSSLQ